MRQSSAIAAIAAIGLDNGKTNAANAPKATAME